MSERYCGFFDDGAADDRDGKYRSFRVIEPEGESVVITERERSSAWIQSDLWIDAAEVRA